MRASAGTSSSGFSSLNALQGEPFTEASISGMTRAEILKCLGISSRNTLGQLRLTLVKASITCFVGKLPDEKVKAIVVQLKLPRYSRKSSRMRGALVKYYLDNKDQQAQIRDQKAC